LNVNKIIIFGVSGFIGKNLAITLKKKFKNTKIIGTYFKNKPDLKDIKLIKCDLRNKKSVDKILKKKTDVVIQAAAVTSGAKEIIEKPYIHVNQNAIINSIITQSAYENYVSHVIIFSCTLMYKSSKKPLKENDFDANSEMYSHYFGGGWMKIFVEKLGEFYSRLNRNKYTLIRHSNIYGPFDKFDLEKSHVFGSSINKVVNSTDQTLTIWGKGTESRDLLYIDDLVRFVMLAIKKQKINYGLYNVGYGKAISINNLVKKIIKIYGKKITIYNDISKKSLENSVFLNCNKAYKELGWKKKISLEQGIKKTLKWYLKNNI
jgi:GDP-L-fucose synthase